MCGGQGEHDTFCEGGAPRSRGGVEEERKNEKKNDGEKGQQIAAFGEKARGRDGLQNIEGRKKGDLVTWTGAHSFG